jgi:hypothetical protein
MSALQRAPAPASHSGRGADRIEHDLDRSFHHWALVSLHLWEIPIVLSLQAAAVLGLLVSLMSWLLVAVATPAPVFLTDIAIREARLLQQRIPAELRGNDSRVA